MELSSEVMVEEGDVELSLGLSLGGGVSYTAFLNPDPHPVGAKEEEVDPVRKWEKLCDHGGNTNTNTDGRKKKKHHHHHHPQQKQWDDQNKRHNPDVNLRLPHYGSLPVMLIQYPYHPQQCVPFGFPYMVPLWSLPTVSSVGPDASAAAQPKNVFQPVPTRSFVPFRGPVIADGRKEGKSAAIHRVPSLTASQGSSFSAISDFHAGSHQGGSSSSSDSRSNATHVVEEKPQRNSSKSSELQQQNSPSTNSHDKIHPIKVNNAEQTDNEHTPDSTKSMATPTIVTQKAEPGLNCTDNEGKSTTSSPAKNDVPAANQVNPIVSNLPEMPCVTTTGNGPNGKKITGFLYRYNKNEVSIVCVCHGSSFSPAEFIKHAGGTEVSHPLRHIVVVPP